MKTTKIFHLRVFISLVVKFSIYLERRVFVTYFAFRVIQMYQINFLGSRTILILCQRSSLPTLFISTTTRRRNHANLG